MIKNKIKMLILGAIVFTGCSSLNDITSNITMPSFSTQTPARINEAIASRVNPETEIYALGKTTITSSGAIVAQGRANKDAKDELRKKIERDIENLYQSYLLDMDKYSKSIVQPVISDLKKYSTDLALKKVNQKGAWQDNEKIYSLLVISRDEIHAISQKVLKDFIDNAARKLENIGSTIR